MQQVADWLEKLGLGQYAQRFAENGIDVSVLRYLTDQDLEKIKRGRDESHWALVAMPLCVAPEWPTRSCRPLSFPRMSQMRLPQTPNERLAGLYRQLALTTSHHSLRDLRRAAERLAAARPAAAAEARAFIDACRMKAAELKSPPAAEKRRNPQPTGGPDTIKMHVTPWVEDKHGILGREIYAIDE